MTGVATDRRSGDRSRPLGITILCLVAGAIPVATILFVPLVFVESPPLALGASVFSIAQLVLVYGLWSLHSWAWAWGLIALASNAVLSLLTTDTLLAATISSLLLVYLWSVRPQYRRARGAPA